VLIKSSLITSSDVSTHFRPGPKSRLRGLTFAEAPLSAISRFSLSPESTEARRLFKAPREDDSWFRADLKRSTPNKNTFMKFVSLRTERTHRHGTFDKPPSATLESFTNPIATSPQTHTYTKLRQQIHHGPPLSTQHVISQPPPFLFTHAKQLAAIIAALTLLFGLWFGVSTYQAPRPGYPYYDTQKPVPPWSEPTPLEGNRDRGGEYR
jgi:hypothetical protein